MKKRLNNPLGYGDPGYVPRKKKGKRRKPKSGKTKKQREAEIARDNYKDRVKRMRGLFGDQFKAKDGYDLRKIGSWTPAQKAKVTRYFRVIAPRITGDFQVRRYRNKDNLNAAIDASLQEKRLPGQTAVAFPVEPGEKLEVKVRNGKATVKRQGFETTKLQFNMATLLENPDEEIDRALAQTDANVFRIITGAYQQNKTLTRSDVKDELMRLINNYDVKNIQRDQNQRPFDEWLNGLIAYEGSARKTFTGVERFVKNHKKRMEQRERDRLDSLAAAKKGISVAQFRRQRTLRKKARKKRKKRK